LHGEVTVNTSKNGAMGLLCAAILNRGTTILHGIPRVEEVERMKEVLSTLGVSVRQLEASSLEIKVPEKLHFENIDKQAGQRMRSTLMLLGGLMHKSQKFQIPFPGGCKMGKRSNVAHLRGLQEFGATLKENKEGLLVEARHLKPADIVLYEMSDTATENLLIAAAGVPGVSTLRFAAANYMVQEVCGFLQALGVKIEGFGTHTLTVAGVSDIRRNIEYFNSEDPTEAMMFIAAAATTGSHLLIRRCPIEFITLELLKLSDMGLKYKIGKHYKSKNGFTELADVEVFASKLHAPHEKIHAQPYPGINTDNLPFFAPIATQAEGQTLIHDWMWENRAIYFAELNRLGAKVTLADPHRVFVEGSTKLTGAQVVCPPALRPATIILVAMLAAEGTSTLRNVYSISRGYEDLARRLNAAGAQIEIVKDITA
jgi:UDP-N-acetylglucosamine 1-carboxyvinyltransferase